MQPANDNVDNGLALVDFRDIAVAILDHHFPGGDAPQGLKMSIIKAMRESQTNGVDWAYRAHGHEAAARTSVESIIAFSLGNS
jgi:hypothetical protein